MPGRQYAYQYETSPRKIKPDYNKPRKNATQYNKPKQKKQQIKTKKKNDVNQIKKQQEEQKTKNALIARTKIFVFFKCMILFAIMFFMLFMNSKISESFSQIQKLKAEITDKQKEIDQLEINIQNSLNLNNVEQKAKELLGMQKLSNKQTSYISLSKKDFVEPRTEKVIIEEETNWFDELIEKIQKIF